MKIIRPKVEIHSLGTVDNGKKLLINSFFNGISYDLVTVTADDKDESLWFEVETQGLRVQIPLDIVKKVVESAPEEVHSETWYEKNVYTDGST